MEHSDDEMEHSDDEMEHSDDEMEHSDDEMEHSRAFTMTLARSFCFFLTLHIDSRRV